MQRHNNRAAAVGRRLLTVVVLVAVGVGVAPAAAHADTVRSATTTGSGPTWASGEANARANARYALSQLASQFGETCRDVTTTATHVYTAPGGAAYVFSSTATGTCGPPPPSPYTVPRSATTQGGGPSPGAALANGDSINRSTILAAGVNCTGWSSTLGSHVYTAPGGAWYIYYVNTTALCTN
jgi:hypothetical protein